MTNTTGRSARLLALTALLCIASGCETPPPPAQPEHPPSVASTPATPTPEPSVTVPTPTGESSESAVQASNAFAFDLHHRLAAQPGNLAYSPASISIALAMTYGGARNETASEMAKVMHFPAAETLHGGWATAVNRWQASTSGYEIATANRLFGEKTYSFEKAFLDATAAHYGAPLEPRDFRNAPNEQRVFINGWVKKQTRDRIVDLIPPPGINSDTSLVLVNALYLKAAWQHPFEKHGTRDAEFFADGKQAVKTPMMNHTAGYRYAATDGVKLLEMPYKGGELAMVVVLPDAKDGLPALEKKLNATVLDGWLGELKRDRVWLTLPKFTIDPPKAIDLAETLKAMGMPQAFDAAKADFTGIANPPNPDDRLYIGHVFHKAFVAVDEAGTEAAAATAVVMPRAGSAAPADPTRFEANHPFLFFIRDVKNNAILFVGRVNNPKTKG